MSSGADVLIDLYHPLFAWQNLHHGLEALDADGFVPQHFWTVPERTLARIEYELDGTLGAKLQGGGAWLIEAKAAGGPTFRCGEAVPSLVQTSTEQRLVGIAGYQGTHPSFKRRPLFLDLPDIGHVGPIVLPAGAQQHQMTLSLAALLSLRECGYRRAILSSVDLASLSALRQFLGTALLSVFECDSFAAPPRVVMCASGNGSNLQAVIDATTSGRLAFDLRRVIVNREDAFALERARRAGLSRQALVWQRAHQSRTDYDRHLYEAIAAEEPDLILLLGWMHILPQSFVQAFPEIINVHPAFLPLDPAADLVVLPDGSTQSAFRGSKSLEAAWVARAAWVGVSVHRVTAEMDRGEVMARRPLRCLENETLSELQQRVHQNEHALLIDALESWRSASPESRL